MAAIIICSDSGAPENKVWHLDVGYLFSVGSNVLLSMAVQQRVAILGSSRKMGHILLLHHLESSLLVLSMEFHTFVLAAKNRNNYLKVVNILPRPSAVTYILGWHQCEISQKERANPELKAMEGLPRPSPIRYILSSKKACPWITDTIAYVSKAREWEKDRMFTSSLLTCRSQLSHYVDGECRLPRACRLLLQSCPTLCDPMDRSLPGSSVHGILWTRILEWVVMPFSRGSSPPRGQTPVSVEPHGRQVLHH